MYHIGNFNICLIDKNSDFHAVSNTYYFFVVIVICSNTYYLGCMLLISKCEHKSDGYFK